MDTLLFSHLLIGPLMLVISLIFCKYPPKQPNAIYGYRTKRSMKSQEAWDEANAYSSQLMLKVSIATIIAQMIGHFLLSGESAILLGVGVLLVGVIAIIPLTETRLKSKFDL